MGIPTAPVWQGVWIIGAWFAAGIWLYCRTRFLEHENRHTLVTELAESGAGDEVIMSIAGHVSRAMLSRYSHVRMETKRRALDEIAARQRAADEKRKEQAEQREQGAAGPSSSGGVVAAPGRHGVADPQKMARHYPLALA